MSEAAKACQPTFPLKTPNLSLFSSLTRDCCLIWGEYVVAVRLCGTALMIFLPPWNTRCGDVRFPLITAVLGTAGKPERRWHWQVPPSRIKGLVLFLHSLSRSFSTFSFYSLYFTTYKVTDSMALKGPRLELSDWLRCSVSAVRSLGWAVRRRTKLVSEISAVRDACANNSAASPGTPDSSRLGLTINTTHARDRASEERPAEHDPIGTSQTLNVYEWGCRLLVSFVMSLSFFFLFFLTAHKMLCLFLATSLFLRMPFRKRLRQK